MKTIRMVHVNRLAEDLANLTLLEAKELVRVLEDDHSIVHINPYEEVLTPKVEEFKPTNYEVFLKSTGPYKLQCIKAVKESMGLGLRDAKDLVDATPCMLKENILKVEATIIKHELEKVGAEVLVNYYIPFK